MTQGRIVWQIGAGTADRYYSDVFLKYGVALIGPGYTGPWNPNMSDGECEGSYVRRFVTEVKDDDTLVLREGSDRIRAIGLVASRYQFLPQFEDLEGWDLQHGRRVRWCELPTPHRFEAPVFGANPQRFSRCWKQEVTSYVNTLLNSPPTRWQTASLPELPREVPPLGDLPEYIQDVVAVVQDLTPLYWDRQHFGLPPKEDELLAHIVVPLLRALGWPVELIAIKWRNIDVTVFNALPRTPENVHFVVEAKRLGKGFTFALEQAKGYLARLGISRDVVVTDGIRYRLYAADDDFQSAAYANLNALKRSAPGLLERLQRPKPISQHRGIAG